MESHNREKMGYWYLKNQEKPILKREPVICSICKKVIQPTELSILNTDGKIICKSCSNKKLENILNKIKEKS